jgi:YVTN family beta-propeller protein/VCBS repeat-containing protein
MGYSTYIGRVGALAVALGIGAALGATPWLAAAEPSTSGSSAHSASTAPSSDSSSTGAATSRTGAVSGKSDSTPSTASRSTQKSTKSPIGQVTSLSESPTPSGSSQPATRSAERGAVVSTGGADTDSPAGFSRSALTAATTAAGGSKPDSTDATAPAQPTRAPATSGTTAAKTTRSAAVANIRASRTTAPASSVDATRVVADAVQTPTTPRVSAVVTTPVRYAATMDSAPDVSVSSRPTPVHTVAEIVSSVVDAVLSPFASGTAPGEPAETPALWTLAAFARREFEQALSPPQPSVNPVAGPTTNGLVIDTPTLTGQSIDPALTGGTAPLADMSVLSGDPQPGATAEPATFTGHPSIVSQVFTGFYRALSAVADFLGVDLATPLGHLLSSDSPPRFTTLGLDVQRSEFEGIPVWTLQSPGSTSEKTVVAIPGSAFIWPPTLFHWLNYAAMARNTGATVIVPIYPLVPQGGTAGTVVPAMADLISAQIDQHGAENISVYGDSLGGTIALAAVQELVRRCDPVPSHMVLISPALDLTLSNPAIQFVDDPIFSGLFFSNVHKNAQLWADDLDPTDPLVSPLYGSLAGLRPTAVYFGSVEIFAPDGLVLQDKALATPGADFTFILRNGELHIWAVNTILPETQAVLPDIYQQLGIGSQASLSSPNVNLVAGPTTNGLVIDTPTLTGLSIDPALTGGTAPLADMSVLTVQLNSQTGAYTYTPTPAARVAAGATALADTDSFTVAVSDGQQSTTAAVSVSVLPIRFENKAPIAVGTNPSAVVVGPDGRMFVANTGSNTVSVINTATDQRIDANSSLLSKDITVGSSPSALALSPDGTRLYVANTGSGTVSVIDTATYKRIDANPSFSKDITVGSSPGALALGPDGRLYVANRASNTVSVINTTTNKLVDINLNVSGTQSIAVGSSPGALALGPDGRLYVANTGSGTVSVINTSSYSVTNTITVGSQPSCAALGTDGRLYVTNTGSGTVSVINTVTSAVIDTDPNALGTNSISVGSSPSSVALSPNGSLAYVANANDTVSVIDTATYAVLRTVAIDSDTTGGHVIAVSLTGTVYVTDAADRTVRVLAVNYGNTAPVAGTPTVGTPNAGNGAVSGALNFTDTDGDALIYSVPTQPASGTVTVNAAGTYTYTPTQTARKQAAQTPGADFATFTVNATDGQATAPVSVTVPIAPVVAATGVTVIGDVTLTGASWGAPVLSADGTRALFTTGPAAWESTGTTRVAVINTATGKQVGTTLTLKGRAAYGLPVFSADGTHALMTTTDGIATTGVTTRVAVINTATGKQTGTTLTLAGIASVTPLSADGTRVLITTTDGDQMWSFTDDGTHALSKTTEGDETTGTQIGTTLISDAGQEFIPLNADGTRGLIVDGDDTATRVSVIDTTTGTQIGTTLTVPGAGGPLLSADKSRAVIVTFGPRSGSDGVYATRVAVMNTTTGTQIGTTVILPGDATNEALFYSQLTADGSRAVIPTPVYRPGGGGPDKDVSVAVVNTADGKQIGTVLSVPGSLMLGPPVLTADGTRVLITTDDFDGEKRTYSTHVAVIDTVTGKQVGTILTFSDRTYYRPLLLSANGTHALFTYSTYSGFGYTNHLAVIDTITGTQSGSINLSGDLTSEPLVTADGTRILIPTVRATTSTVTVLRVT